MAVRRTRGGTRRPSCTSGWATRTNSPTVGRLRNFRPMPPLRLVFLGSDPIALPTLEFLAGEGRELAEVVAV